MQVTDKFEWCLDCRGIGHSTNGHLCPKCGGIGGRYVFVPWSPEAPKGNSAIDQQDEIERLAFVRPDEKFQP